MNTEFIVGMLFGSIGLLFGIKDNNQFLIVISILLFIMIRTFIIEDKINKIMRKK